MNALLFHALTVTRASRTSKEPPLVLTIKSTIPPTSVTPNVRTVLCPKFWFLSEWQTTKNNIQLSISFNRQDPYWVPKSNLLIVYTCCRMEPQGNKEFAMLCITLTRSLTTWLIFCPVQLYLQNIITLLGLNIMLGIGESWHNDISLSKLN